ncbi:hypothetical protein UFOVP529_22 [uncultured Caudovirales phage]|uniref:Uncharacterized protein n=1 Tax=uncultured Caudovirales phage TaxID=2100421 RepID=A0A6J5REY2_9CAUD|nr:hypothetical protein UFOVP529_22 [uncultured Caudovirales phage]CAB4190631.1 hypothetical protein UFOVP1191_80 [uncultured Caudovirales phage]CAB4194512.1 hypothetical protein UFOVP1252_98 [uncultured Caudovirales phage]
MAYGNTAAPEKRKAFAADYVEVADRIRAWYEAYPNARIETEIVSINDKLVVVKAYAYRGENPDEKPAGIGHSSMNIPGSTPYTRGSELENTETSAAGRALVMAGLPSKKIASGDEIRAKSGAAPKADPVVAAAKNIFDDVDIKDSPTVLGWLDAISGANDAGELQKIGQQIASLDLSENERGVLQNAWKNKRAKFA